MSVPDKGNMPGCLGNKFNTPKKYAEKSPSCWDLLSLIVTLRGHLLLMQKHSIKIQSFKEMDNREY